MSFHHDKLGQILVEFEKNSQALFRYVKQGPSTYLAKISFFRPQMSDVNENEKCGHKSVMFGQQKQKLCPSTELNLLHF